MKNNFDDYTDKLKKVKLDPSRKNLAPVSQDISFEELTAQAIKEGFAMLAAEDKKASKHSVKPTSPNILENALGEMSTNPYIRARIEVLKKMTPAARSEIEKMEAGTLDKDHRYDTFVSIVSALGDELSNQN